MANDLQSYSVCENESGGYGIQNTVDNCIFEPYNWYKQYYYPVYQPLYPTIIQEDKFGKAFKVLEGLMKAKVVRIEKIDKFMEAINLIVREL